jgi:hypothetical protein
MKRVLLITLSLVLALGGWSAVCAEDGFYVVPSMRGNYAPVPKTGQTQKYYTGDDGVWEKGVAWPTPRFTDNGNGTVTDKLTGLMWLKDANCMAHNYPGVDQDETVGDGEVTWVHALDFVFNINLGSYPLCGGGYNDWRLPNIRELNSLIDYSRTPAFPVDTPFTGVVYGPYWSSTTLPSFSMALAYIVDFGDASTYNNSKTACHYVWPVRGGK